MTRFGLDNSQKNHIVANDRRKRGTIAIDRDSMAANEHSPVREKRDDAPTIP